MEDRGLFMMSPMDADGEARLRQVRACIHKTFGPGGTGRRTKRTLEMPTVPPTPAKTPRTKMRQRIEKASQLNAEKLFFQEFGSCEELMNTEFDLARPAAPTASRRYIAPAPAHATQQQQTTTAATSYFSFTSSVAPTSAASAFTSSLPAPSTANASQLTRPSRVRTPRKAAIKRGRVGESSAEKALVLRKPRLGSSSHARNIDYSSAAGSTLAFGSHTTTAAAPTFEARKSFALVTNRGDQLKQPSASTRFFSRTSPSKFQFSSNATRLFSQRQAPLR